MTISWLQAIILGIFACLSSMPGMGGTTIGNYTLGRPLVAGLVCGIVLGDIQAGVLVGAAMQVVYIALVTPGGTVSADVRAVSYIGIPLAMLAIAIVTDVRRNAVRTSSPRFAIRTLEVCHGDKVCPRAAAVRAVLDVAVRHTQVHAASTAA